MGERELTELEIAELEGLRCPVCGVWHLQLQVCPFIKLQSRKQVITYERDQATKQKAPRVTSEEQTTEYYPRVGQLLTVHDHEGALLQLETIQKAKLVLAKAEADQKAAAAARAKIQVVP